MSLIKEEKELQDACIKANVAYTRVTYKDQDTMINISDNGYYVKAKGATLKETLELAWIDIKLTRYWSKRLNLNQLQNTQSN